MRIETLRWLVRRLPGQTRVWDIPSDMLAQALRIEKARAANTGREPYNRERMYQGVALVQGRRKEVNR